MTDRTRRLRRPLAIAAVALVALAVAIGAGGWMAARALRAQIVASLGPAAEVGAVHLRPGSVVIEALRVRAPADWPVRESLSARRVVVVPELSSLLGDRIRIARITVDDATLAVLRTGDGRLHAVPRALDALPADHAPRTTPADRGGAPAPDGPREAVTPGSRSRPAVTIDRIVLRGGTVELHDAAVARPPHRMRLESVSARIDDVAWPALSTHTRVRLDGALASAARAGAPPGGRVAIDGWVVPATKDARLALKASGIDLVALQPYLQRAADSGVRGGRLDLQLDAAVDAGRLRAPGRLALSALELSSGGFLGLPREAVLALLADRAGRIELDVTVEGRLDDPRFSITDDLVRRLATGLGNRLASRAGDRAIDAIRGLLGR